MVFDTKLSTDYDQENGCTNVGQLLSFDCTVIEHPVLKSPRSLPANPFYYPSPVSIDGLEVLCHISHHCHLLLNSLLPFPPGFASRVLGDRFIDLSWGSFQALATFMLGFIPAL